MPTALKINRYVHGLYVSSQAMEFLSGGDAEAEWSSCYEKEQFYLT